jgi:hypothetical protein
MNHQFLSFEFLFNDSIFIVFNQKDELVADKENAKIKITAGNNYLIHIFSTKGVRGIWHHHLDQQIFSQWSSVSAATSNVSVTRSTTTEGCVDQGKLAAWTRMRVYPC